VSVWYVLTKSYALQLADYISSMLINIWNATACCLHVIVPSGTGFDMSKHEWLQCTGCSGHINASGLACLWASSCDEVFYVSASWFDVPTASAISSYSHRTVMCLVGC